MEWAYLAANTQDCSIVDAYARNDDIQDSIEAIRAANPQLVVLSSTPSYLFWRCPPLNIGLLSRYATPLGALGIPVIVIGPHGTSDPAWTLRHTNARFVFRGEVEALPPFDVLSEALNSGKTLAGVCRAGCIVSAAPETPSLQRAAYTSMELRYPIHTWIREMATRFERVAGALVEAGRGCAWDCAFCFRGGFRRRLRLKDLGLLAAELDELSRAGVGYVYFIDETFGVPWEHYASVLQLVSQRGLLFGMQTRPDVWTSERISQLRDNGCVYAEVGMEAVMPDQLARLGKFSNSTRAINGLEHLRAAIPFVGANVFDFGVPELGVLARGADDIRDPAGLRPLAFIPYPDTPMGKRAIENSKVDGSAWDVAGALHAVFALENRFRFGRMLRRSMWLRRLLIRLILRSKSDGIIGDLTRTRFENRQRSNHGR